MGARGLGLKFGMDAVADFLHENAVAMQFVTGADGAFLGRDIRRFGPGEWNRLGSIF